MTTTKRTATNRRVDTFLDAARRAAAHWHRPGANPGISYTYAAQGIMDPTWRDRNKRVGR